MKEHLQGNISPKEHTEDAYEVPAVLPELNKF